MTYFPLLNSLTYKILRTTVLFNKLGQKEQVVVEKIIEACSRIIDWLKINPLSANAKKFQVIYIGKTINNTILTHNVKVKPKTTVKVRGYKHDFSSNSSEKMLPFPEELYQWSHICSIFHPHASRCCHILWNFVGIKYNKMDLKRKQALTWR